MFGALFGHKDDVKTAEGNSLSQSENPTTDKTEGYNAAIGRLGLELLNGTLCSPKTYERLVHDLYVAGWTIEEVKTLLNGEKIEKNQQ